MRSLDPMSLDALAKLIIGENYPGIEYRSNLEIDNFLRRADSSVRREPGGRKQTVVDLLNALNSSITQDDDHDLINPVLESIICRLVDPREFGGADDRTKPVLTALNRVLSTEGLAVTYVGATPEIVTVEPHVTPTDPVSVHACPEFSWLTQDRRLLDNLKRRWVEAENCVAAKAHLATVLMLGSILEAVLLVVIKDHPEKANRSGYSPKEQGKEKHFRDWTLHDCIEVASDCGWIQGDRHRFSHALRESRNLIHAHAQMVSGEWPDESSCRICWQVVNAALDDVISAYRREVTGK